MPNTRTPAWWYEPPDDRHCPECNDCELGECLTWKHRGCRMHSYSEGIEEMEDA